MTTDRRGFLQCASVASLTPALMSLAPGEAFQDQAAVNNDVFNFWASNIRAPYNEFLTGESKGVTKPQQRNSVFLFPSTTKGLVPASTLNASDIVNFPDDGNKDVT